MRTIVKKQLVLLTLLAVSFVTFVGLSPSAARALSCAPDSFEVGSSIEGADAIFAGKVTSLNPQTIPGGYMGAFQAGNGVWSDAVFEVSKYWKGDVTKTMKTKVALYGWYSETPSFEVGKEYLIYARKHPDISGLVVYVDCARQPLLSQAQEDLAALGTGKAPVANPGTDPDDDEEDDEDIPVYDVGGTDPATTTGTGTGTGTGITPIARVNYGDTPTNQPTTPPTYTSDTFTRSLTLGSRGTDVVQLQTILETKGFLVMPAGVGKGYFGPLTRAALARYQASVGISPAVGFFGPITRNYISLHP